MRGLFRFLLHNHVFILFLFLETISMVMVFNFNNYQKVAFLNSSNKFAGKINKTFSSVTNYFSLASVNRDLATENARLREMLLSTGKIQAINDSIITRSEQQSLLYRVVPAKVISNSVNRQHNYLILDKGETDGVKVDQGIISSAGVAGIVTNVSKSYATGISLLNLRCNISARIKSSNYFGSLSWDGKDYTSALLNEIPFHVELSIGDTIVTSGYSSIFPEGLMLGTIMSFNKDGGESFYNIRVKLAVDFKSITFVEVIENLNQEELKQVEKLIRDGEKLD